MPRKLPAPPSSLTKSFVALLVRLWPNRCSCQTCCGEHSGGGCGCTWARLALLLRQRLRRRGLVLSRPTVVVWCATGVNVVADANYPPPVAWPTWCSVPNYRYYRFTPLRARGYAETVERNCALAAGKPDGCFCLTPEECRSRYCVPNDLGAGGCTYPVVQFAELEFWRAGRRVNTRKVPDENHDAFRILNGVDVSQTWGVWELEFYSDTLCNNRINTGAPIASSQRSRGFGHSVDHSAPPPLGGPHDTPRTYWQATHETPLEKFELHGPAVFAFDGDIRTNWWATCEAPCRAFTEWLGISLSAREPNGMKCVRVLQDSDKDYASFSLVVQGRRVGSGNLSVGVVDVWDTFARFNAATWEWGGVWEKLSVPQGVAFVSSVAHARVLDSDMQSSVVELVGTPFTFDFGVETEIDSWRWATAQEPADYFDLQPDGVSCDRDARCPRDPVRWRLDGSLDATTWVTLSSQENADYPVTIYRRRWVPFFQVLHQLALSVVDIWPDGRGKCAARR